MRRLLRISRTYSPAAAFRPVSGISRTVSASPSFSQRSLKTSSSFQQQEQQNIRFDAAKNAERRLQMTFTCTAEGCGHRSAHEFSAQAYNHGIVLLTCPSCKNRHLIADHIGWFKESTEDGKLKTVEDLLKARGEQVRRGRLIGNDGDIEYYPDSSGDSSKS